MATNLDSGFYNLSPTYPSGFNAALSFVTPFTHRTNISYAELLMELYKWLRNQHLPELDALLKDFEDKYAKDFQTLKDDITNVKNDWENLFNIFMADVVNQIKILNDKAVAELMDNQISETGLTLRNIISEYTLDVVANATSPEVDLDHIHILAKFPLAVEGGNEFFQGFSINSITDEIYVSSQSGASLRIDIRNFAGELLRSKRFTVADGAYSEGLPYFVNNAGNLSFIIQASTVPDTYNILDFETGVISPEIPRPGKSRIDSFNGELVSSDALATWVNKFYIYDFASVASGLPVMKTVTPVENPGKTIVKSQAVAMTQNNLYLFGGSQEENPGITMYDKNGKVIVKRIWPKSELRKSLLKLDPDLKIGESYFHESEGATNYKGKLVTGHVIDGGDEMESTIFILLHDATRGVPVVSETSATRPYDTDWINLELAEGWGQNPAIQYRLVAGEVQMRGELFNATQEVDTYSQFGTLPEGFRPSRTMRFPVTHTNIGMAIRVDTGGAIRASVSVKTGLPRPLNTIRYRVD